jgi:hypothetical protein
VGALRSNTTGGWNTASGNYALRNNTFGNKNTASGAYALLYNATGSENIGIGYQGGRDLLLSDNIAIGNYGTATDSGTIRIGTSSTHSTAFVAGIRGVTTANADAIPVLIDSGGQLGTVSSSRRFKEDIRDMDDATERLMDLRPVLFRFKEREGPDEYGLIAEEVAEVSPELVVFDEEGQPFTVKYHLLSTMLLNEVQRMQRELDEVRVRDAEVASLGSDLAALTERLAALEQPDR